MSSTPARVLRGTAVGAVVVVRGTTLLAREWRRRATRRRDRAPKPRTWRGITTPIDGRAPRLAPDEAISADITRLGVFRQRDPLQRGRGATTGELLGLVAWGGVVGTAFRGAVKEHGGWAAATGRTDDNEADHTAEPA